MKKPRCPEKFGAAERVGIPSGRSSSSTSSDSTSRSRSSEASTASTSSRRTRRCHCSNRWWRPASWAGKSDGGSGPGRNEGPAGNRGSLVTPQGARTLIRSRSARSESIPDGARVRRRDVLAGSSMSTISLLEVGSGVCVTFRNSDSSKRPWRPALRDANLPQVGVHVLGSPPRTPIAGCVSSPSPRPSLLRAGEAILHPSPSRAHPDGPASVGHVQTTWRRHNRGHGLGRS
jgi:hypothetical protein